MLNINRTYKMQTLLFLLLVCDVFGFKFDSRPKRQGFDDSSSCIDINNQQGTCINIKQCPPLVKLLQQVSSNPAARDTLRRSQCGFEGRVPKVCCVDDSFSEPTRATPPNVRPTRPSSPFTDGRPPQPDDNLMGNEDAPAKFPRKCGKSGATYEKVVGGKPSVLYAWPWMAALGYRSTNSRKPISWACGGTLVTERHVVSAAHCLERRVIMIRLGELNFNTTSDGAKHIDVQVDETIPHRSYDKRAGVNDIGVIRLRNPVQFSADIQPICLPFSQTLRRKSVVGFFPYIAGWGDLQYNAVTAPTQLMEAQVEIKETDKCVQRYRQISTRVIIDDRVICAGGDLIDTCQGDSGGPLMLPQQQLFYLYGVVSYGYKCAEPGVPGVYTRVTEFLDWIDENTN